MHDGLAGFSRNDFVPTRSERRNDLLGPLWLDEDGRAMHGGHAL